MDCHEDDGLHFVVPASLLLNDDFEVKIYKCDPFWENLPKWTETTI